jgi:hypothetical protein
MVVTVDPGNSFDISNITSGFTDHVPGQLGCREIALWGVRSHDWVTEVGIMAFMGGIFIPMGHK